MFHKQIDSFFLTDNTDMIVNARAGEVVFLFHTAGMLLSRSSYNRSLKWVRCNKLIGGIAV